MLRSNAATPLLSNTGERELMTLKPQLRLHLSPVDQVIFGASREAVRVKRIAAADANRDTADLIWQHHLSAADKLMFSINRGESTRKDADEADYKYQIARLGYQAQLNHLMYDIQLGYQKLGREAKKNLANPITRLILVTIKWPQLLSRRKLCCNRYFIWRWQRRITG